MFWVGTGHNRLTLTFPKIEKKKYNYAKARAKVLFESGIIHSVLKLFSYSASIKLLFWRHVQLQLLLYFQVSNARFDIRTNNIAALEMAAKIKLKRNVSLWDCVSKGVFFDGIF